MRLVRRGVPNSRPYWAVSLATVDDAGKLERVTVVVVDAHTREIAEVRTGDS